MKRILSERWVGILARSISPRAGFTLIEILMTLAIVAALGTIVFAVAARSKAAAKEAPCIANLRQLGHALALYESDFGRLPRTHGDLAKSSYVGDRRIHVCAVDPVGKWVTLTKACGGEDLGFDTSYDSVLGQDMLIEKLVEADANHGMFVCRMHGSRTRFFNPEFDCMGARLAFEGLLLRLRKDTSVQCARLRVKNAAGKFAVYNWEFWTDAPNPYREMREGIR